MSLTSTSGGANLALPEDELTGLEDVEASDLVIPRLTIDHKTAQFVDNLTGNSFPTINAILLGLVKQRILWDTDVDEGDQPMCKSLDAKIGNPAANFPWQASGFDQAGVTPDEAGKIVLPCASCNLKEWGTDPKNGKAPWCSVQHTYPLLLEVGNGWAPALFTTQRTGIKPSNTYITAFARSGTPLYTVHTTLSLQVMKRGSVDYAVPGFVRGEPTDQDQWTFYAQQYRQIREFITTPRVLDDDKTTTSAAPAAASAPPAAAPAAASAPPAAAATGLGEDDEVPF